MKRRSAVLLALLGGALAVLVPGLPAAAATTAPVTTTAWTPSSGGLDPNTSERATSMLAPNSPDATGVTVPPPATGTRSANAVAAFQDAAATDPLGIDVSRWQHPNNAPIDWAAAKNSGISFAFVKSTESTGYVNPFYAQDVAGARAAGLYVGAYHYARPDFSATAQADLMADTIAASGPTTLPAVLDLEDPGSLNSDQLIAWTAAFLNELTARTGRVPIIYGGQGFWNAHMAASAAFGAYPLWDANYTTRTSPAVINGWTRWTFWQYSDGSFPTTAPPAPVPGVPALVDRNRFSGTAADLAVFANGVTGRWVVCVETNVLGSTPAASQVNAYSQLINDGRASRASVAKELVLSSGGLVVEVKDDYQLVLGRAADSAGLVGFAGFRAQGMNEAGTRAALAGSPEFYQAAGSTPSGYIQLLYSRILGRPADSAGLAGWTDLLAHGYSRQQVATAFATSAEGLGAEVSSVYRKVLRRAADPAGLAGWTALMASGLTYETVAASFYSSGEYQTAIVGGL